MKNKTLITILIIILLSSFVSSADLTDGVISAWKFETDPSTTDAEDELGAYDSIFDSDMRLNTTDCMEGNCWDVITTSAAYVLLHRNIVTSRPAFTFGCWIKQNRLDGAWVYPMYVGSSQETGFYFSTGDYYVRFYDGTQTGEQSSESPIIGTWHFMGMRHNSSIGVDAYLNSILAHSIPARTLPLQADTDFWLMSRDATPNIEGNIDECILYDRALNDEEMTLLMDGTNFYPFLPPIIPGKPDPPLFSDPTPPEGTHNKTSILINATTNQTNLNWYLWLDEIPVYINTTENGTSHVLYTTDFTEGNHTVKIALYNSTNKNFSTNITRYFIFDSIAPVITINPNNGFNIFNTTKINAYNTDLQLNISIFDDNLAQAVINITNSTGATILFLENISITLTTQNYTNITRLNNIQPQTLKVHIFGGDSHTKEKIKNYKIKIGFFKKYIDYETTEGLDIRIETLKSWLSIDETTTTKLKDRYQFKWKFKEKQQEVTFKVTSDFKLIYIEDSEDNGHFMTMNGLQGNWIDFNSESLTKENYQITKIDDYTYEIKIINVDQKNFIFNSLGGLNTKEAHYTFEITSTLNITVYDPILNITLNFTAELNNDGLILNSSESPGTPSMVQFTNVSKGVQTIVVKVPTYLPRTVERNVIENFHNFSINMYVQNTIDDCTLYTKLILNYTLWDEDNLSQIHLQDEFIKIDVQLYQDGVIDPILDYSNKFLGNNATVCVLEGLLNNTHSLFVSAEYEATGYEHEFEYIQNLRINISNGNIPQHKKLYDLKSTNSLSFIITFKNNVFLPVNNAIIEILRFYSDLGTTLVVEDALTDEQGQTIGHLLEEDALYDFIVKKDRVILATFEGLLAICPELPCEINLNQFDSITTIDDFDYNVDNLAYVYNFNKSTRNITVLFSTLDSSSTSMELRTILFDNLGNTTVCTDTIISSSGTLACTIPAIFGNVTVESKLLKNGEFVTRRIHNLKVHSFDVFGYTGYFMAALLYITLPFMAIATPVGAIIFSIVGLIFAGALGLIAVSKLFALGSTILWFAIAGIILIWKIHKKQ